MVKHTNNTLSNHAKSEVQRSRRQLLAAATTLFVLPVVPSIGHAAEIVAVRTWPAEEYTRVTLEMDTELRAKHFTLDGPDRLVVDIEGLRMSEALDTLISKIEHDDPYIDAVRIGQNTPDVVRLVIDLKQSIAPQVFTLKPVGKDQYRLVIEIGRAKRREKDQMLALT